MYTGIEVTMKALPGKIKHFLDQKVCSLLSTRGVEVPCDMLGLLCACLHGVLSSVACITSPQDFAFGMARAADGH